MKKSNKFSPEIHPRTVPMVLEHMKPADSKQVVLTSFKSQTSNNRRFRYPIIKRENAYLSPHASRLYFGSLALVQKKLISSGKLKPIEAELAALFLLFSRLA